MNKALSTLTAATAGVGLAVASTSAKAFIIAPAVAAAALAGGIFGGAVLGSAVTANNYPTTVAVAPEPSVTVNSTTCYFTHRWINHVRTRVQVCNSPVVAAAPLAAPAYTYEPPVVATAPVVETAPMVAPIGGCEIIAGNRVCH
jgi:hypothetical protein